MSETYNPYSAMFEMQRESIERTREFFHRSVELGTQSNRMVLDGIESNRSVQAKGREVAHSIVTTSLESVATAMPGSNATMDDIDAAVDDQFEAMDEVSTQYWDALGEIIEENTQAYEAATDEYLDLIDETIDTTLENLTTYRSEVEAAQVQSTE